ncbi:AbfB domain-containing protein [Deinococcus sp.]|uniref:AbfB domain-containing protein n=1 Tax=Deinococcus sp. TaxID=47478 RepID=UPI003B58FD96
MSKHHTHAALVLAGLTLALSACGSPQNAVKPPAASPVKSQVVAGCTTTNAALNRPSLSSSNETGNNLSGKAFDGDLVSRWSSAFSDNEWIYVDLGSVQNICGVTLIWEAAYGSSFKVQVSNDASNWTDIYSTTTATGGTQNLKTAGSGQYVRMLGIKRGSPYGYSLHEFQVFTGATPPTTSATLNTGQNYSLQVTNAGLTNRSLRHYISQAFTEVVDSGSNATLKADASFKAVAGLADGNCYSFQSINFPSQYLRHANSRLRIDADNGGTFKADATFCAKAALSGLAGAVSLEAKNFPGRFIRHRNAEVWVEASTGGSFNTDASWKPIAAWSNTAPPPPPPPPTDPFTLVWSDEFNGPSGSGVNAQFWNQETGNAANGGWGNQELQYYTSGTQNTFMDGQGSLEIQLKRSSDPTLACWNGRACDYTSGRLTTAGKQRFTYGKIEARIKVPSGVGLWPAFWSLGEGAGGWPNIGEIDFMEVVGRDPNTVYGTLHGPGYSGGSAIGGTTNLGKAVSDDYHIFTVIKRPNEIIWYVDGRQYFRMTPANIPAGSQWVFEKSFFVILNLAIGGPFPGSPNASTPYPASMKVDYVRIFREN